jgi:biopolymer transport protein ExbB
VSNVRSIIEAVGYTVLAQSPAAADRAASLPASVQVESVWDFVVKGGVMMIPIGLCSLIALTVVAERLVSLRRRRIIPPRFVPELREQMQLGGGARAMAYCRENDSPIANVFLAGLKRIGGPIEVIERHIDEAGRREVRKLRKRLRVLSVIAAVSPLLGLLGTIFGMIRAFQTVAMSAEALGKTEMLATGIYEAMITTAAGLIVAIPALVFYHYLSARVQTLVMDVDQETVEFLEDLIERGEVALEQTNGANAETTPASDELPATAQAALAT